MTSTSCSRVCVNCFTSIFSLNLTLAFARAFFFPNSLTCLSSSSSSMCFYLIKTSILSRSSGLGSRVLLSSDFLKNLPSAACATIVWTWVAAMLFLPFIAGRLDAEWKTECYFRWFIAKEGRPDVYETSCIVPISLTLWLPVRTLGGSDCFDYEVIRVWFLLVVASYSRFFLLAERTWAMSFDEE